MGWIKLDHDIHEKPEVIAMACDLGIDRCHVVGYLVKVWIWADKHTTDGNASSVTKTFIDSYLGVTNFADAMQKVGWLDDAEGGICIPNFDRHNGDGAKKRIQNAARQEKFKKQQEGNAKVTLGALPEKKRSINKPLPLFGNPKQIPPDPKQAIAYGATLPLPEREVQAWLDYWLARDWKFPKGGSVKDWQASLRTWSKSPFRKPETRSVSLQEAREAAR
jgi:hypothetical protein